MQACIYAGRQTDSTDTCTYRAFKYACTYTDKYAYTYTYACAYAHTHTLDKNG